MFKHQKLPHRLKLKFTGDIRFHFIWKMVINLILIINLNIFYCYWENERKKNAAVLWILIFHQIADSRLSMLLTHAESQPASRLFHLSAHTHDAPSIFREMAISHFNWVQLVAGLLVFFYYERHIQWRENRLIIGLINNNNRTHVFNFFVFFRHIQFQFHYYKPHY